MKISLQRTLFEIINFVLAILFVIPLGVLMEQLCGQSLYQCCMIPCLAVLGHIIGRFSMKMPVKISILMCLGGAVISLILAILLCPGFQLVSVLICLVTVFFAVFFFFSARKAGYTVHAPMTVVGVLLHILVLICCTGFQWSGAVTKLVSTVAIVFFLLTLFSMSAKSLRKSLHRGTGVKQVVYPAGMQMGNFLLVAGFIIIAAFISNIYPIFNLFSSAFGYVIRAIISAFAFFISLFDRRGVATDVEEGVSQEAAQESIMNVEPKGEAAWVTGMVEVIAFICVLAMACYFVVKIISKLRQSGMRLPGWLRDLKDKFLPVLDEDFVDETESLFDPQKLLKDTGDRLKSSLKKLRERPQRIDDFEDPKLKVRFAYQQLLKRVSIRDPQANTKTPNEIYRAEYSGEDDFREFMDYYNQARYSHTPLPDDAEDSARAILKQKL